MRSRGERISITSWGIPDNGRASDGSLTVRLKQPSMPYPSRYISIGRESGCHRESLPVYTRRGLRVNDHYKYTTHTFTPAIYLPTEMPQKYVSVNSDYNDGAKVFLQLTLRLSRFITSVSFTRLEESIRVRIFESLTIYGHLNTRVSLYYISYISNYKFEFFISCSILFKKNKKM